MKTKKYHYIYKTLNLINGKYYVGVHSTNNLEDGYLGSGTAIVEAIQKYGEDNFKKEILEFFNCAEDKWLAEIKYVTLDVVRDPNSYNQACGGRNWIAAMKRAGDPNLSNHQSKAGKIGALSYLASMNEEQLREWHSKGGKIAAAKTVLNKTGFHKPEIREKQRASVSQAIKGTVELWHPDAPTCVSNRNSPGYVSGWSVRVKPLSEKHFMFLEMGYTQRISTSDIISGK
jgi:hypothetical protein